MGEALAQHDHLLRLAIETRGGSVVKTTGDGMLAVFGDPVDAAGAALAAQRALRDATWGETGPLRVRMAFHAGAAETRDGDYFGPALNRVARILSIGHGGQVICSAVAADLARDRLGASVELVDLGSHRLRDIDRPEQVYQVVAPDLPRTFPPLRSLSTRRSNLPLALTSFVGREKELAEVTALVEHHRLVTLIGTGGTGKTRLMLEAAGQLLDRHPDGVWLAELAPLGDESQIASEVARALGAPEVPGVPALAVVTAFVADKDLLLLLDNAEHLVDGAARLAERLLASAPRLRIVATSREALAIPGEAVLHVRSLSCPAVVGAQAGIPGTAGGMEDAASTEAVQLFIARAAAVDPAFALSQSNVASVAEICRRLDGIPLAIELAAARVSAMSPDDIAKRLGDRFRLLAGGRRTAVPRQQTLHALIDWSWDLLTDEDRRLLRRLAVFTGGWTVSIASRIVGDDEGGMDPVDLVEGLTRLVDRSLVIVDRGPTTRYRMLETIRQYAREKLIESGEAARSRRPPSRRLRRARGRGRGADPRSGDGRLAGPARRRGRQPRCRSGVGPRGSTMDVGQDVRRPDGLLGRPRHLTGQRRPDRRRDRVRENTGQGSSRRRPGGAGARGTAAGRSRAHLGDVRTRDRSARAGPRTRSSWPTRAMTLPPRRAAIVGLAVATVFAGRAGPNGVAVRRIFEEAVDLSERSGEWWAVAMAAGFAGTSLSTFDPEAGEALLKRGIEAARRSGSPYAIGAVAMAQGRSLGHTGQTDDAVAAFGVAIRSFTELGDTRFVLASRSDLAHALRRGGRLDEAMAMYHETIGGWVHLGQKGAIANQLENVAYVEVERGRFDRATCLLGAAAAIREASGSHMAYDEEPELAAYLERLRGAMAPDAFEAAWSSGQALPQADAVALALAEDLAPA